MDEKKYNNIIEWADEKGGLEFKAFIEIIYKAYVDGTILNFEDETQSFSGQVKRIGFFYNSRFPDFDSLLRWEMMYIKDLHILRWKILRYCRIPSMLL